MRNFKTVLFSLVFIFVNSLMFGQALETSRVQVQLSGTSTIHDWVMNSYHGDFSGTLEGKEIRDAKFVMKAEDLHSSRRGMDANAYRALNTEKYPNITFETSKLRNGVVDGKLTINNVTKNIQIPLAIQKTKGFYLVKGQTELNMSDYNITPPTFYNTIKTGDQVSISFYLILKEAK
ncbi:YceI family protein [Weeksellaceae bacterium TAE3-ERU29]|nr:YceI family protein [Weeksellaceae bacterium TAE3-ERU29]